MRKVVARESSLSPALEYAHSPFVMAPFQNCEFVGEQILLHTPKALHLHCPGLDLVPLHPDLSHLRSSDLDSRITWVQANWLVHMVRYSAYLTVIAVSVLRDFRFPTKNLILCAWVTHRSSPVSILIGQIVKTHQTLSAWDP